MQKTLITLLLYFLTYNLDAQSLGRYEQIDSMFENIHTTPNDWIISLSIEQAGTLYDSLGNSTSPDPEGTFLFLKLGRNLFLQKVEFEYLENSLGTRVIFGKRLSLLNSSEFNYSLDSILRACEETIYPFVYKVDSDNAYAVQEPANHEPFYTMHFKPAQREGCIKFFNETSLSDSKSFSPYQNINYKFNSRTFIYRSYLKLIGLAKENMKVF